MKSLLPRSGGAAAGGGGGGGGGGGVRTLCDVRTRVAVIFGRHVTGRRLAQWRSTCFACRPLE